MVSLQCRTGRGSNDIRVQVRPQVGKHIPDRSGKVLYNIRTCGEILNEPLSSPRLCTAMYSKYPSSTAHTPDLCFISQNYILPEASRKQRASHTRILTHPGFTLCQAVCGNKIIIIIIKVLKPDLIRGCSAYSSTIS